MRDFIRDLDTNQDGEIDLWEFCVHLQKSAEGTTRADLMAEIDTAFSELFRADEDGKVRAQRVRPVFRR